MNKTESPLISVIIPVNNRPDLLPRAVNSVLSQSFGNFELIIVDDGSEELTKQVIQGFVNNYPQKVIAYFTENKGVSSARNLGISKARGEYLAFLDSDDLWISTKLAKQINFMQTKKVHICQTEEAWIRRGKRVNPMKKHQKRSGSIFYDSLDLCLVSPSAVMIKKEVFQQVGIFDVKLQACEDYDLWLRISLHYPIFLLRESLIEKYGGHADQLSAKYWGMDRFRIYALLKLLKDNSAHLDIFKKRAIYKTIEKKSKIIASGSLKRKNFSLYIKYIELFMYFKLRYFFA